MTYIIEGPGALANETGEETPLKAGDFARVNPDEKHQYLNKYIKPLKMICAISPISGTMNKSGYIVSDI